MPRSKKHHYRGHDLDSGLELDVIKELYVDRRKLKKAFKFSREGEVLDYTVQGKYNPDFIIEREDGHKIYVEVKGYLDENSRRKMVAVRRCHPDKDIRFLFDKNNLLRKGAKMRLTEWALKLGFNGAAVGRKIPVEWLTVELDQEQKQ